MNLKKAVVQGTCDLSVDVFKSIKLKAKYISTMRKINEEDGQSYNEYTLAIKRSTGEKKEWVSRFVISDLIYYLQVYCPHVCQDDMPEELIDEVERTNNRDNGDVLT